MNATNARLAVASDAPKSSVSRNVAQSPPACSITIAVTPARTSIANGTNRARPAIAAASTGAASACRSSSSGSRPRTTSTSNPTATIPTTDRWATRERPAALAWAAPSPPTRAPTLHTPCNRFITGTCLRALIHEPWRFIEMSMRTSQNMNALTATRNTSAVLASPIKGSATTATVPPTMSTRRVEIARRSARRTCWTAPRTPRRTSSVGRTGPRTRRSGHGSRASGRRTKRSLHR